MKNFEILHGNNGTLERTDIEASNEFEAAGKYLRANPNVRRRSICVRDKDTEEVFEPVCKDTEDFLYQYSDYRIDIPKENASRCWEFAFHHKDRQFGYVDFRCSVEADSFDEAIGIFLDYHDLCLNNTFEMYES